MLDAARISETLVDLADTLVSDYDLQDYLDRLLSRSVAALGADAGGVMLSLSGSDSQELSLLACTDEDARVVELLELQRKEGPCVDSHRLGIPVVEHDLSQSDRWPHFAPVAMDRGFHAVYAFPMRLRDSVIGALNLFREEPGAVDADEVRAAQAMADMATIGILQHRAVEDARVLAGQLQRALNSRVVIEQAKGVLAERLGCDVDHAFQVLRRYARNTNQRIRAVAAAVIAGDLTAEAVASQARPPAP